MRSMQKTVVALVTLGLLMASSALVNPSSRWLEDAEERGTISWSRTCGGAGNLRNISLDNCNAQNCTVRLDVAYSGSLGFVLAANQSSLTVNVNAIGKRNGTLYTYSYSGSYSRGSNVTLPYTVRFIRNLYTNQTGNYNVQVSVRGGSTTEICREFGVYLAN